MPVVPVEPEVVAGEEWHLSRMVELGLASCIQKFVRQTRDLLDSQSGRLYNHRYPRSLRNGRICCSFEDYGRSQLMDSLLVMEELVEGDRLVLPGSGVLQELRDLRGVLVDLDLVEVLEQADRSPVLGAPR